MNLEISRRLYYGIGTHFPLGSKLKLSKEAEWQMVCRRHLSGVTFACIVVDAVAGGGVGTRDGALDLEGGLAIVPDLSA